MNIAYNIWIEKLDSNIIKGQVIETLKAVSKSADYKIYIFSFYLFHTLLFSRKKLKNIKDELKSNNIYLILIPFLGLPRVNWFSAYWYMLPIIVIQSFPLLLFMSIRKKIDIIHCRSYVPMIASLFVKKIKKDIRVVFDPRSPFPEENITSKRWSNSSISYKLWKRCEIWFLKQADSVIAISSTYTKHYKKAFGASKIFEIPNNVNIDIFKADSIKKLEMRNKLGIGIDEIVFVYCGSLKCNWNNPDTYANFIEKARKLSIKHRFLFITSDKDNVKHIFDEREINSDEYIIVSANFKDVPQYLNAGDIGINLMEIPDIRLSIKSVEYLAMGLPLLINSNVLGAKALVKKYSVGIILGEKWDMNLYLIENLINDLKKITEHCRKTACEIFSTYKVAEKYTNMYQMISNKEQLIHIEIIRN